MKQLLNKIKPYLYGAAASAVIYALIILAGKVHYYYRVVHTMEWILINSKVAF